jgi:hypothetical protein
MSITLLHAFIGWFLCAATMGIGMSVTTLESALYIHATLAPIYFFIISLVYFKKHPQSSSIMTASIFVAFVILIDFFLVALLINRSLEMFSSFLGTWIPFASIFLFTYLAGKFVAHQNKQRPHEVHTILFHTINKMNPKEIYRALLILCAFYFMAVSIAHQMGTKIPLLFIFYDIPSERYQDLIISFLSFGWALLFTIGFLDNELKTKIHVPILFSCLTAVCGLIRARNGIKFHHEIDYEIIGLALLFFTLVTIYYQAVKRKNNSK